LALPRDLEDEAAGGTELEHVVRRASPVLRRLDEGVVCPARLSGAPRLLSFVQTHFTSFDLPPGLSEEILALAPPGIRPLSPAELRAYLRRKLTEGKKRERRLLHPAWAGLHSAGFCLEVLDFCALDLGAVSGSYEQLAGLFVLPLATGAVAMVGQLGPFGAPLLVATLQQQKLLPHLAPRFVSPLCAEHSRLGPLFLYDRCPFRTIYSIIYIGYYIINASYVCSAPS